MSTADGIAAVIVTRNRLALLRESIAGIRQQTRRVAAIFVIDNGSDDGTQEWLAEQKDVTIVAQVNSGSSGGFFTGIKTAYESGYQWFWCMDDDTIPDSTCLAGMCETKEFALSDTGTLSSLVRWKDGTLHRMNLPMISAHSTWIDQVLDRKTIPTISSSFVSLMISRPAVRACGLPLKEMFIWGDDTEYTRRISRRFPCFTCLESQVLHATDKNEADALSALEPKTRWKFQHGYRNNAYLIATGEGAPWQKAMLLFRRLRAAFGEVTRLGKVSYFPMLLCAVLRGVFSFRPGIVFPGNETAPAESSDGPS